MGSTTFGWNISRLVPYFNEMQREQDSICLKQNSVKLMKRTPVTSQKPFLQLNVYTLFPFEQLIVTVN
jgi:hypothetical protein